MATKNNTTDAPKPQERKMTAKAFASTRPDFSVFDRAVFQSVLYSKDDLRTRAEWVKEAQKQGVLNEKGVKPKN